MYKKYVIVVLTVMTILALSGCDLEKVHKEIDKSAADTSNAIDNFFDSIEDALTKDSHTTSSDENTSKEYVSLANNPTEPEPETFVDPIEPYEGYTVLQSIFLSDDNSISPEELKTRAKASGLHPASYDSVSEETGETLKIHVLISEGSYKKRDGYTSPDYTSDTDMIWAIFRYNYETKDYYLDQKWYIFKGEDVIARYHVRDNEFFTQESLLGHHMAPRSSAWEAMNAAISMANQE